MDKTSTIKASIQNSQRNYRKILKQIILKRHLVHLFRFMVKLKKGNFLVDKFLQPLLVKMLPNFCHNFFQPSHFFFGHLWAFRPKFLPPGNSAWMLHTNSYLIYIFKKRCSIKIYGIQANNTLGRLCFSFSHKVIFLPVLPKIISNNHSS